MINLPYPAAIRYRFKKDARWTYQEGEHHARPSGWAPEKFEKLYTQEQVLQLLAKVGIHEVQDVVILQGVSTPPKVVLSELPVELQVPNFKES